MAHELETQKRLTHVFIEMSGAVEIVLTPRSRVRQPSGGFVLTAGTPRASQRMKLIEASAPSSLSDLSVTLDGVQRKIELELLGVWDAAVAVYDTFEYDGRDWEVVSIPFFNGWERKAVVSGRL